MRSGSAPGSRARKCCRRIRPGYRRRSWVAVAVAHARSRPSTRDPLVSAGGPMPAPESLPSPRGAHLEMVGAVLAGDGPRGVPPIGSPRGAHLEMVGAVLAGDGLERIAEIASQHAGVPVAVIVPRLATPVEAWAPYERYVARRLAGGKPDRPADVYGEVPIVSGGHELGAGLDVGPGGAPGPRARPD